MTEPRSGLTRAAAVRAAISDAYYEARNDHRTMEQAADDAAKAVLDLVYIPTPEDLDALASNVSLCSYASEAVEVVEDWTRAHWGVESAMTTKMGVSETA